ncbi:hypothetical protein Ea357_031 [Erwinia phage Ea35-70]|uniref:Uncharacterized protein n=2 Tax=Agricanvirus TaxID=1984776 RepID=W6ARV5_9CAUD|nr:hypothetical protein Ea357_031 [Erwinia phage Ea35-70]AHI60181.1 hypothetical protein Ea357_031 [Erwinia phage Ea35-70]AUG86459.1 hypothetical protein MADMEL_31 [Erwinia phage vB_EamM_MadMel]
MIQPINVPGMVINPEISREVILMTSEQLDRFSIAAFDMLALGNTVFSGEFGSYVTPSRDEFMQAYLRPLQAPDSVRRYNEIDQTQVACLVDSITRNEKGDLIGRVIPHGPNGPKLEKLFKEKKQKFKVFPRLKWENGWKFVAFDVGYK